jgi:hypothetical protein
MSWSSLPHADDWVQVADVAQIWQGELIVGRLREEGIDAQLVDQEKARRVMSESLELPEDSELKGEDGGIR